MIQIAKEAKDTSKSASTMSYLRREAMKKIVKDTADADIATTKKAFKSVTILDKMQNYCKLNFLYFIHSTHGGLVMSFAI